MPDHPPAPDTTDDETLAAALAAALDAADPADLADITLTAGMSQADVARACGISEGTVANITRMFRARLAARLLNDPAAPRNLLIHARRILTHL